MEDEDVYTGFIEKYKDEYKIYYKQAYEYVKNTLSRQLEKVKHLPTGRAKDPDKLAKKLKSRWEEKIIPALREGVSLKQDPHKIILDKIVDLAGVRIALYFPRNRMDVEPAIFQLFGNVERIPHPENERPRNSPKRFAGYCAEHYRVDADCHIKLPDGNEYTLRVEIQVVSMLMHAWMEVEHDLVYKTEDSNKTLLFDELAVLDAVNGLVIAGDVALEGLEQKLMQPDRDILPLGSDPEWVIKSLNSAKQCALIVGQNLYTMLSNNTVKDAVIAKLQAINGFDIHIIVAEIGKPLRYDPPNYTDTRFKEDLEKSIQILEQWLQAAQKNKCGNQLHAYTSDQVERETVGFFDPESESDGKLVLKRVPFGSAPEMRPQVHIPFKDHPKTFKDMWDKYEKIRGLATELKIS